MSAPVANQPSLLSPRVALLNQLAEAREGLNTFNRTAESDGTALRGLLKEVRNQAGSFADGLAQARADNLGRKRQLESRMRSIGDLPGDAPLRLKSGRLKALPSSNSVKEWLGIGNAKRQHEADTLARTYDGARTRDGLGKVLQAKLDCDATIIQAHFRESAVPLQRVMNQALAFSLREIQRCAGQADIQDFNGSILRQMHLAVSNVETPLNRMGMVEFFERYCDAIKTDHATHVSERRSTLRAAVEEARVALHDHDRQQRVQLRESKVQGLVPADLGKRDSMVRILERRFAELTGAGAFFDVLTTNKGCERVQEMLHGQRSWMKGRSVTDEIKRTHGDDIFAKGARDKLVSLELHANSLNPEKLNEIATVILQLGLIGYANGDALKTSWRRSTHSASAVALLRKLAGTGNPIRSQQFLFTADEKDDTLKYPVRGGSNRERVDFVITGISSRQVVSHYAPLGEGQQRIYPPQSCFVVDSFKKAQDGYVVELREIPVHPDLRKNVPLLMR